MGKFINRICFTLCFALFYLCSLRAEYSCDGGKCSDHKLGLSALAGVHSTALHSASMQGVGINALFSQYNPHYGFAFNFTFGILHSRFKNAKNAIIAYDKDTFSTSSGYVQTNVFFAKNLKNNVYNPFFMGVLLGWEGVYFDEKYGVPNSVLLTLGLGLSGSYMLSHNLAFEYGASYNYGVYAKHSYPISYLADRYTLLKPNNHQVRLFLGIHKNKTYGVFAKAHLSLTHLDSARNAITNRYGSVSIYPQSMQVMFGLECGFGFNQWL